MLSSERIKSLFVRTPFEGVSRRIRWVLEYPDRRKHPELADLYLEESRIELILHKVLREDSNCIDIGCHLGSMLSLILKLSPRGRHMAFEPVPSKAQWLRKKFPEVDVRQMALGDTSAKLTFYHNTSRSGFSSLVRHPCDDDGVEELSIDCEPLDRVVPEGHRVDFMKVDVEGYEPQVFRGAVELLRRSQPILLFESIRSDLPELANKPVDLMEFLCGSLNYSIFTPDGFLKGTEPLTLDQFRAAHEYPFQAINFCAAPRGTS
jgi:FkbM family methyltransferase